jgi:hypothetical protein
VLLSTLSYMYSRVIEKRFVFVLSCVFLFDEEIILRLEASSF